MNIVKILFAQVMEYVPWKNFGRIIDRYGGDSGVRTLSDLRADCHRQEGASFGGLALHIDTDFVGVGFRENPDFTRLAARHPHNCNTAQR